MIGYLIFVFAIAELSSSIGAMDATSRGLFRQQHFQTDEYQVSSTGYILPLVHRLIRCAPHEVVWLSRHKHLR